MTERGTVHFGATKDTWAWLAKLPASLSPSMRIRHYQPSGFNQKMKSVMDGDAERASEMYAGRFIFGGKRMSASPREIFSKVNTDLEWLCHFSASNRSLHDQYAMRLLNYWSVSKPRKSDIFHQAKILMALATDGQIIARRCETPVQSTFFEIVAPSLKKLISFRANNAEQSISKAIALLYCLNSFQGIGQLREMAFELIERNLSHIILPDGGHVSGDIVKLVTFLEGTVPLAKLSAPILPPQLMRAVENGLALLKLVQCPDGNLSGLVSGVAGSASLQQLLNVSGIEIPKLDSAPHAGFARIEHEKTTLIADSSSHLGLELCDGKQRMIKTAFLNLGQKRPAIMQSASQGTVLVMEAGNARRTCFLSANGQDLRVEEQSPMIAIVIEVAQGIKLSSLMEGQAAMLVLPDHSVWQLKQRGGVLDIRQSNAQFEIVIHPGDGGQINWSLKKQAKPVKTPRKKQGFESGLLI